MIDDDLNEIAETIANKSPWGKSTDNWTRIYQAARAGAALCATAISGQRADHDVAIGEHAFRAGWEAKETTLAMTGGHLVDVNRAWSNYDPPEELKGGGPA